ncbi:NAD(P)-binding domain [Phytophthora cactorum]|nr:NAD(P)-binding domain [Phytophthora cactorum]
MSGGSETSRASKCCLEACTPDGSVGTGVAFVDASTVVYVVRVLLFLYFIMASLDLALTRYHLWEFEPTTPELKRYALVTGASSGLGREMSYLLAEQKYSLVLAARTETVLERMRAEIELVNRPTEGWCVSVTWRRLKGYKLIKLSRTRNGHRILVNNAGACLTKDFTELKETEIDELMTLDMHAMRKVGRVLNISSIAGAFAVPTAALYGSSKAFMTNFTQIDWSYRHVYVSWTSGYDFSKTANLDKAVCMTLPGLAADAKDTAKMALDAMFNGEILVYDTWFAYLTANLVQSIIPGRLAAFCFGAGMHELKNIWQMAKR